MDTDPLIASFVDDYRREISALVTVLVAAIIARVVDRAFVSRGEKLSAAVAGGDLSAATATRLRLVRRLVFAVIIVIGIALGLSQFEGVKRLATGVLASSAVLGIVVGFAARQTLANAVAGVMLAVTQPIRIGDLITFEEDTGTVEDVKLTYTFVRTEDGRRLVVPNERLASSTIENHTIVDPRVHVEVSVWLPHDAEVERAVEVLGQEGVEVSVADVEKEGVRISIGTWVDTVAERGPRAAELRVESLERLRRERLSSPLARSSAE